MEVRFNIFQEIESLCKNWWDYKVKIIKKKEINEEKKNY